MPGVPQTSREHDFYVEVGGLVRVARKARGLTQDELAVSVNLTRTSITNIEHGRQKVLLHTFAALAATLRRMPAELLPSAVYQPDHAPVACPARGDDPTGRAQEP